MIKMIFGSYLQLHSHIMSDGMFLCKIHFQKKGELYIAFLYGDYYIFQCLWMHKVC